MAEDALLSRIPSALKSRMPLAVLLIAAGCAVIPLGVHAANSSSSPEVWPSDVLLWFARLPFDDELSANPYEVVVRDLDDLLALDTEFHRYQATHWMVFNATDARLVEILEQSENIEDSNLQRALQHRILREMAHRRPQEALDTALNFQSDHRRFLISGVFRSLASDDLDAAVNSAKELAEPNRTLALESILVYNDSLSNEQKRNLALALGEDYDADTLLERSYSELSVEELKQAWKSMLDSHLLGTYRNSSLQAIANAWIDKEDFHVVRSICRSIPNLNDRSRVLHLVLRHLSDTEPQAAFELAVECHVNQMDWPLTSIVDAWAQREPMEALKAVSNMELTSLRYPLRRIVVDEWAKFDTEEILRNPGLLPNDLQEWGVANAVEVVSLFSPRRASRLISRVHPDFLDDVEFSVALHWTNFSWRAPSRWLELRSKNRKVSVDSWFAVLGRIAEENSKRAFDISRRYSSQYEDNGLEFVGILAVAESDVSQAKLFLSQLDKGRPKSVASRELGEFLVDRAQFDDAIELRDLLVGSERREYLQSLFDHWARYDPVQLFAWVTDSDGSDLRQRGALALEKADARRKSLSDAEMKQIRSLALEQE